jgi:hypothetical protein
MATKKHPRITVFATAVALLIMPMRGLTGSTPLMPLNIVVQVSSPATIKVQSAADFSPLRQQNAGNLAPSGFTAPGADSPVLVLNTPPVKPEVIIDVAADVAGPNVSETMGDSKSEFASQEAGGKQLSLKDVGVAPPPPSRRAEGSNLKEAFERAAGEVIYRLDLLNKVKIDRQVPVVITVNL